eukprot:6002940-Amphidinium_carterae.1
MISRLVYNAVWLKCNAHKLNQHLVQRTYAFRGLYPIQSPYSLKGFDPSFADSWQMWTVPVRKGKSALTQNQ